MGVAPGIPTEFWYFSSQDFCFDIYAYTSYLLRQTDVPLVHSVSYGYQGTSLEQVPPRGTPLARVMRWLCCTALTLCSDP